MSIFTKTISTFNLGGKTWFLLLFCLFGYATLSKGFAYIGYYPFFIGEISLLFYLLVLRHRILLPAFLKTVAGKVWLIFFVYNMVIFLFSAMYDLNESIRNSIYWVYTIFFYIGFSYGRALIRKGRIVNFEKFLLFVSFCILLNSTLFISYDFRNSLKQSTSFLYSGEGFLGNLSSYDAVGNGFIFYFLFFKILPYRMLFVILGLSLTILFWQSRAAVLGIIAIIIYIFFVNRRRYLIRNIFVIFATLFFSISIFYLSDVRLGSRATLSTLLNSIFKESSEGNLGGTRSQRLEWWGDVIHRTCSSPKKIILGMGFNELLVDRIGTEGNQQRYPHNSFITIFGFSGILGLFFYLFLLYVIIKKIYSIPKNINKSILLEWYPVLMIGFLTSAFFGTILEAPFQNFPFWVITGVIYCIATQTKHKSKKPLILQKPANKNSPYPGNQS